MIAEPRRTRGVEQAMRKRALVGVLCLLCGCPGGAPAGDGTSPPPPPRAYSGDPAGLAALWGDILTAAHRDEREKVHDLMASLWMTDDDLAALFGPAEARRLAPRYAPLVARLVNIGAMELVAQVVDKKYDDVAVVAVDGTGGSAIDRATVAALPPHTPIYTVRVKRKTDKLGLRYDFFVFRRGRWLTGNLLGKYLVAEAAARP